jgi:toxin ParE1/3/4
VKQLLFADPAADDLRDIVDYIALDNPAAAEQVYRRIVEATTRLRRFSDLGRPGRVPDTREFMVSRLPYVIVYETDEDTVTVLAVFHAARDWPRLLVERRADKAPR